MDRKYLKPLLVALILILAVCLGLELSQARLEKPQDPAKDLAQDPAATEAFRPTETQQQTVPTETEQAESVTPPDTPTEAMETTEVTEATEPTEAAEVTEATEETTSKESQGSALPPNMLPIG